MESIFVEPAELNSMQLFYQTAIYGYILYQASNLISGGSELLQLIPSMSAIVGSIVLPVLGAVPDGMMVLCSGIGENAQETVKVGVGALAGSTVMLLTFPWFICVLFGGVPLNDQGQADYSLKKANTAPPLFERGIKFNEAIPQGAIIMIATTFLYAIIQIPASMAELSGISTEGQGAQDNMPALIGLVCCIVSFFLYLKQGMKLSTEQLLKAKITEKIHSRSMSIEHAKEILKTVSDHGKGDKENLLDNGKDLLQQIIDPFFRSFDVDRNGTLSVIERGALLKQLGLNEKRGDDLDRDKDGKVTLEEFTTWVHENEDAEKGAVKVVNAALGEDEEEVPEDLIDLPIQEQMRKIKIRAAWTMALGTILVVAFSDPMVDALSEWGNRLGVSSFYVSFIVAPFASNASELLSAYTFAVKRTEGTITTSLSTLLGAACMNNTFVLAIFLALVWYQKLAWQFTAETISMVLIQWIIGFLAYKQTTHTFKTAVIILLCYPACLMLVMFLENVVGLD